MPFVSQIKKDAAKAQGANQKQVTVTGGKPKEKAKFDWKLLLIPAAILVMGLLALGAFRARALGKAGEPNSAVKATAEAVAKPVQAVTHVAEEATQTVVQPIKQVARYYFGLD